MFYLVAIAITAYIVGVPMGFIKARHMETEVDRQTVRDLAEAQRRR